MRRTTPPSPWGHTRRALLTIFVRAPYHPTWLRVQAVSAALLVRNQRSWMAQVITMAVLSVGWLGVDAARGAQQGRPASALWEGYGDVIAWLVLLWPAVGQYSTGEAAQVAGQAR
jgi:hypothetical protein